MIKEIYEVKKIDYPTEKTKSICAYADKQAAIYKIKMLNAKYGDESPFFVEKKVISNEIH